MNSHTLNSQKYAHMPRTHIFFFILGILIGILVLTPFDVGDSDLFSRVLDESRASLSVLRASSASVHEHKLETNSNHSSTIQINLDWGVTNVGMKQGDTILSLRVPSEEDYHYDPQPNVVAKASKKFFADLPANREKTFYSFNGVIQHAMIRVLHHRGWTRVKHMEDARFVWTYPRYEQWYPQFKPWQRYNHLPGTNKWNRKNEFAAGFRQYKENGNNPFAIPISFDLQMKEEIEDFRDLLFNKGGLDRPWVLKITDQEGGRGITMLGPQSNELKKVLETVANSDQRHIIQEYICNEKTWKKRKFDLRMFWFVASLDPLIVFYMDGYVRVGAAEYDENNFNDTTAHKTTHTFLGEEDKASWEQLEQYAREHWTHQDISEIEDPARHLRSQIKHSLAQLVEAFKARGAFKLQYANNKYNLASEDGFELYGADFIIDEDLDAWFIEAQTTIGVEDERYFKLDVHHNVYHGMVTILDEIWDKQAKGEPILPLKNTGKWQLIYVDGWKYTYDGYERSKEKKSCGLKK